MKRKGRMDRRRGGLGHGIALAALSLASLLGACAPAYPPPEPPVVADPLLAADDGSPSGADEGWDRVGAVLSPEFQPPADVELPPPPPPVWAAPQVVLWPEQPAEGSAVSVFVRPIAGAKVPLSAEASLDGRPVPLSTVEDGWFGIGAVPIGTAGHRVLKLRYRVTADSVLEEVHPFAVLEQEFPARQLRVEPRFVEPPADVLARIERERTRIRGALAAVSPEWHAGPAFDWPRPPSFTSRFGERRMFNERLRSRHWGLDFTGVVGEEVLAAADGHVVLADDFYYQGGAVYLDHGLGVYTGYFHLSRVDVTEGQAVRRGDVLGAVGATGRVTGPHLHWSATVGGQNVDPASLLDLRLPPVPEHVQAEQGPASAPSASPALSTDDGESAEGAGADPATEAAPDRAGSR